MYINKIIKLEKINISDKQVYERKNHETNAVGEFRFFWGLQPENLGLIQLENLTKNVKTARGISLANHNNFKMINILITIMSVLI